MAEKVMINGTSALRVITIEASERPQAIKLRVAAYDPPLSGLSIQRDSLPGVRISFLPGMRWPV